MRPTLLSKLIEGCWLAAAGLVPLVIAYESSMVGFVSVPKVFLLRSLSLLIVTLVTLEWALRPSRPSASDQLGLTVVKQRIVLGFGWLRARPVMLAVSAVALANLIAWAFSPIRSVSAGGVNAGWDSYGLFSVASYLVVFAVVALRVRTKAQLERLIWTLTATSALIGLYGIGQHFGVDWFVDNPKVTARIGMTFGNPIFAGAWMLMTVPLTLALWQTKRDRMPGYIHIWIGAGLILVQVTVIVFTLSRGPWIAFGSAMLLFLGAAGWVYGFKAAFRPAASIAIAFGVLAFFLFLPETGGSKATSQVVSRVESSAPQFTPSGGGLNGRYDIWATAADTFLNGPWVDTERFPELPSLGFKPLRPLIGYGPEMFGSAYALGEYPTLTTPPARNGHNFLVHTALELGLFGVFAYVALTIALAWTLLRILLAAKRGLIPPWIGYLGIGLISALAGRSIEQMAGLAQVSDMSLSWILAGAIFALAALSIGNLASGPADMRPLAEATPQTGGRRRRASRRASRGGVSSGSVGNPVRIVVAVTVAIISLVFWSQAIFPHVRAALTSADAREAAKQGQAEAAFLLLDRSVSQAPNSALARLSLSGSLLRSVGGESDLGRQRVVLDRAYEEVQAILDRNPLDDRAWARAGEISREIALMDPAMTERAILDNETLAELLPSRWRERVQVAWSLNRLGAHDKALEAVLVAKALIPPSHGGASFLYYVEAKVFQDLGRTEEANLAIENLSAYTSSTAQGLLDELLGNGEG